MERYTINNNNNNNNKQCSPKLPQMNETVFHSNQMFATNQFGQLCYETTGQKKTQGGIPATAITTIASQPNLQLHMPRNITSVCNSNTTTSHNTAGVYAKHIFTSTHAGDQSGLELNAQHTDTPAKKAVVAETTSKSFQGSTDRSSNVIYQRPQQSQNSAQIPKVSTKSNVTLSTADHHQQNSYPETSTAVAPARTLSPTTATASNSTPSAPLMSHQQGKVYYHCDICMKPFAQRHYLAIHKRSHTGEKPFQCDFCIQKFARRDTLQIHRRIHTGEKPFHCEVCSKQFAQRDKLQIHRRTHSRKKQFHCDICLKQFAQRDYVEIHKRSHTGEKPFVCDFCLQKFVRKNTLDIHRRMHTGERPYDCEICGEKFAQTDKLRRHKKSAHGVTGGASGAGGDTKTETLAPSPNSDPDTSNPGSVPTSNIVAYAAASSKITEDYPTINNQLWLL